MAIVPFKKPAASGPQSGRSTARATERATEDAPLSLSAYRECRSKTRVRSLARELLLFAVRMDLPVRNDEGEPYLVFFVDGPERYLALSPALSPVDAGWASYGAALRLVKKPMGEASFGWTASRLREWKDSFGSRYEEVLNHAMGDGEEAQE